MAIWDNMPQGELNDTLFLLKEYQIGVGRAGKKYLTLTLATKEGEIDAKLWDEVASIEPELARNVPVRVSGILGSYRDKPQITIRSIQRLQWNDDLFTELVPASRFPRSALEPAIRALLGTVRDAWIKGAATALLEMPQVSDAYFEAPAAKGMHHAYLRGLSEHSLSMMRLADLAFGHFERLYPGLLCRDELIFGAFVHDLGKVVEYTYLEGIDISLRGRLVGHLAVGLMLLNDAIRTMPGFPEPTADRLRHLILAHHGEPEKGSPVWPITAEALLLHHIDHLDAEINSLAGLVAQSGSDDMTTFNTKFGRRFINPNGATPYTWKAETEPPAEPVAAEPVPAVTAPVQQPTPAEEVAAEPLPAVPAPVQQPTPAEEVAADPTPEAGAEGESSADASRPRGRPKKVPSGPSLF